MRSTLACLLFALLLPACGDAPEAPAGAAGPGTRLGDRIAASLADEFQATLEARADPRLVAALSDPAGVTILSLHPWDAESLAGSSDPEERALAGGPQFHGYPILGQKTLDQADDRRQIATLVAEGIARSQEEVADCFEPRHGLRIQGAGHRIELVICYACLQMLVYYDPTSTEPEGTNTHDSVGGRVTDFFLAHGIPVDGEDAPAGAPGDER